MTNVENTTPNVARIDIITFWSNKSLKSTWRDPANNKNESIPPIKVILKSILFKSEYEKSTNGGEKYPTIKIKNDNINDKSITPIVIGILISLKFKYINAAETLTNKDDISNIFNTSRQSHQNQSCHPRHQDHVTYLWQHYSS